MEWLGAPDGERRAECLARLVSSERVRACCTLGGLPVIVPVRFRYAHGELDFEAADLPGLVTPGREEVVALQADGVDDGSEWSVVVVGYARLLAGHAAELRSPVARLRPELVSAVVTPVPGDA